MKTTARGLSLTFQSESLGTGDGTTTAFTLSQTPYSNADLDVYADRLIQFLTADFTVSGTTVTFVTAPSAGVDLYAKYFRST